MLLEVEASRLLMRKSLVQQRKVLTESLAELSMLQPASNVDAMDMT
jgi:hypothetical protein